MDQNFYLFTQYGKNSTFWVELSVGGKKTQEGYWHSIMIDEKMIPYANHSFGRSVDWKKNATKKYKQLSKTKTCF